MSSIPDKRYFRIGEVSKITGLEPYILRYWESEFDEIRPQRSNKQRLYRKKDVELIFLIKRLLYEEKFTISGARKKIREEGGRQLEMPFTKRALHQALEEIEQELIDIKRLLDSK